MSATESLARIWLPTGIAAGTPRNPSKSEAVLAVRSGDGWTAAGGARITLFNGFHSPVVGPGAGWAVRRDDATYELIVADD
jgi:hypothetical protein